MSWERGPAVEFLRQIGKPLHDLGWMTAMYGSTLYAPPGRDLDLILVPWRVADSEQAVDWLVRKGGVVVDRHLSIDGSLGVAFTFPPGELVDCLFVRRAL